MPNLTRVEHDLKNGRLWKARDRLFGLFSSYPASQEVLLLLGEVFYKMGDLPEAGRYWFLTERNDGLAQEALMAYRERCGKNPCIMLKQLPIRVHFDKYGPVALKRVQALVDQCPDGKPRKLNSHLQEEELEDMWEPLKKNWRDRIVMYLSLIFLIGPWLAGFFTLGIWLTSLIAPSLGQYLLTHWFDLLNL